MLHGSLSLSLLLLLLLLLLLPAALARSFTCIIITILIIIVVATIIITIVIIIRQRPYPYWGPLSRQGSVRRGTRLAGARGPAAGALLRGPTMTIVTMMTMMWLRSCLDVVHVARSCLRSALA